jgi:citrate synthase
MSSDQIASPAEVHKGLEGVVAGETAISDVDGQRCQLIYRGYHIDELSGRATYEEVSYLLLHGVLPTSAQLSEWTRQLSEARPLEPALLSILQAFPRRSGSMALLRTMMSSLGLFDPEADDDSIGAVQRKAVRAIAKTPTIVAAIGRLHAGSTPIAPAAHLGHAANFLYMLLGQEPSLEQASALDAYFVLLADHGFNASTFTARTVTGTQSDYYSAVTAAIGSLKGPLHGAANRKAMEMLEEIRSVAQVEPYVQRTLADHKRFMGFGHRVYKGEDPRAKHLKAIAKRLGDASNEPQWFAISERLQEAVWSAKKLYINVDFYSASLLHYLGISTELFTTMFACARMAGWSAHIIEQASNNRLIRPLALYTGSRDLRFVPIDQRSSH